MTIPSALPHRPAAATGGLEPAPAARSWAGDPGAEEAAAAIRSRNPKADPLRLLPDVHPERIPRHVAVIMDGNGRWATARGLPRAAGHQAGAPAVRRTVEEFGRVGVEVVTLYSFSMENWKRPREEVEALMALYLEQMRSQRALFFENGIRFRQIGRREGLPEAVVEAAAEMEAATAHHRCATLCLAVNYGARSELVDAARELARRAAAGKLDPEAIDEAMVAGALYTAGLPDPDLMVRTAGELRLSNYLLWQLSYAELHVTGTLWPDFGPADVHAAVRAFASRTRKFGGLAGAPAAS